MARGPIPDKPRSRPTVERVVGLVRAYRSLPENDCGGSLHIVLDDRNLEDSHVAFCRDYAIERHDIDGAMIAGLMLQMTRSQRARVYRRQHD